MGISAAAILILRFLHADYILEVISSRAANWGIILLTVAVFALLALDRYELSHLLKSHLQSCGMDCCPCRNPGGKGSLQILGFGKPESTRQNTLPGRLKT